jgi:hypothetical protein
MKKDHLAEAYGSIYKKEDEEVLKEGMKASGDTDTGKTLDPDNVHDDAAEGKEGYKGASDIKNTGAGVADEAPDEQSPAKKRQRVDIKENAKMLGNSSFEELYNATLNEDDIPDIESGEFADEEGDFPTGDVEEEASPEETLQQIAGLVKDLYDALSGYMGDEEEGYEDDMGMEDDLGGGEEMYDAVSQPEPKPFSTNPQKEVKRKLSHEKGPKEVKSKADTGSSQKRDGSLQSGKGKVSTGPSGNPLKHPANSVAGKASGDRRALEEV